MDGMREDPAAIEAVATTQALDFEELFRAQYLHLAKALYLLGGNRSEAEDLAQEAFARVYERWGRVRIMDSPVGYLYRTALNLHRKRRRRPVRVPIEAAPRPYADPADTAERRAAIREALLALSGAQREALVAVEWLGLDAAEAGALLGVSAESVRSRVHRARVVLRERLGGSDG